MEWIMEPLGGFRDMSAATLGTCCSAHAYACIGGNGCTDVYMSCTCQGGLIVCSSHNPNL